MSSLLFSRQLPPASPSMRRAREKSRRDFLSWLGVGVAAAAVGCSAPSAESEVEGSAPLSRDEEGELEALAACTPTTRDAKGPYYEAGAPVRPQLAGPDEPGVRLALAGRLVGPDCRTPLANYTLDLWQADALGNYHSGAGHRLRGKVKTDAEGRYAFETILPGRYGDAAGIRPAHIHVTFLSPGQNALLTTQIYFAGDPYLGQEDYCTRQGTCNSSDAARILTLHEASSGIGKRATFNAIMPRT